MGEAKFLMFDSETEARLVDGKIRDGIANIEGKSFFVQTSRPLILKEKLGKIKPLYFIDWSSIEPSSNYNPRFSLDAEDASKPSQKDGPKFNRNSAKDITPELLRKMMGLKILGNMIKPKRDIDIGGFGMFIIGAVLVVVIAYIAILFGWIKLG